MSDKGEESRMKGDTTVTDDKTALHHPCPVWTAVELLRGISGSQPRLDGGHAYCEDYPDCAFRVQVGEGETGCGLVTQPIAVVTVHQDGVNHDELVRLAVNMRRAGFTT